MIGKLRLKIIATVMLVLLAVFVVIFTTINVYMQTTSARQTEQFLSLIADQDGDFFPMPVVPPTGEPSLPVGGLPSEFSMRGGGYLYAKLDHAGEITTINAERLYVLTEEDALTLVEEIIAQGDARGAIDNLQYLVEKKPYGSIIVVAERSTQLHILSQLLSISLWVILISSMVLLVMCIFISKWAVKPVQEAFTKQRQFISDASHELKTPLTILSANADMLENEFGENAWLTNIKTQSRQMGELISDLLTLARIDEHKQDVIMTAFDLSKAVLNATLEFESIAYEAGKTLTYDIAEGVICVGDKPHIKQLIAILIDNAIKHSDERGIIRITLAAEGDRAKLSVFNTGAGIADAEREKVFERFYRSDASRSRETGGYGLGLSIAKSIVDAHHGKVTVESKQDAFVCFHVMLKAAPPQATPLA